MYSIFHAPMDPGPPSRPPAAFAAPAPLPGVFERAATELSAELEAQQRSIFRRFLIEELGLPPEQAELIS